VMHKPTCSPVRSPTTLTSDRTWSARQNSCDPQEHSLRGVNADGANSQD
jgi:hypothetical protein